MARSAAMPAVNHRSLQQELQDHERVRDGDWKGGERVFGPSAKNWDGHAGMHPPGRARSPAGHPPSSFPRKTAPPSRPAARGSQKPGAAMGATSQLATPWAVQRRAGVGQAR